MSPVASRLAPRALLFVLLSLWPLATSFAAEGEGEGGDAGAKARVRGIVARFESLAAGSSRVDARRDRLLALRVEAGESPTPFLAPGGFRVRWAGWIDVEFLDDYEFSCEGRGRFRLEIDGRKVLEVEGDDLSRAEPARVELEGGPRRIVGRYESPARGDAVLRLLWSSLDFPPEPPEPRILSCDPGDPDLVAGERRRLGRNLFARRRCAGCHRPAGGEAAGGSRGMPELLAEGPSLEAAGARFDPAWLARWIEDPGALRPGARMPRVLALWSVEGGSERELARDAAAWLATLGSAAGSPAPRGGSAARGEKTFEALGCGQCHLLSGEAPDPGDPRDSGRVSLARVAAKYRPGALAAFLRAPAARYPSIRMPDFQLQEGEARDLEAFLRRRNPPVIEGEDLSAARLSPANLERGRRVVLEAGCLGCHPLEGEENLRKAPSLEALAASERTSGCLAPGPARRGSAPRFAFTDEERSALAEFLPEAIPSLARRSALEYAERRIVELRCSTCHRRDGVVDLWTARTAGAAEPVDPTAIPEAARVRQPGEPEPDPSEIDQRRPPLTWTGEKLRTPWLGRFLAGEVEYRLRPWLAARMPTFAGDPRLLARGLALGHAASPEDPPERPRDPKLAELGRRLAARDGGFSCHSCHDAGNERATAVFDAKGPNFAYATARLRREFFLRWMANPPRLAEGTKMPQFADDSGRTAIAGILDGNGRKQFEAIWEYLRAGRKIRSPD